MTGKEKCELLREIRRQIAESNDIVYLSAECHHTGDCAGTCPLCDAEIRYLDDEINRKIENGERVTVSGLSVNAFENYPCLYMLHISDHSWILYPHRNS